MRESAKLALEALRAWRDDTIEKYGGQPVVSLPLTVFWPNKDKSSVSITANDLINACNAVECSIERNYTLAEQHTLEFPKETKDGS